MMVGARRRGIVWRHCRRLGWPARLDAIGLPIGQVLRVLLLLPLLLLLLLQMWRLQMLLLRMLLLRMLLRVLLLLQMLLLLQLQLMLVLLLLVLLLLLLLLQLQLLLMEQALCLVECVLALKVGQHLMGLYVFGIGGRHSIILHILELLRKGSGTNETW